MEQERFYSLEEAAVYLSEALGEPKTIRQVRYLTQLDEQNDAHLPIWGKEKGSRRWLISESALEAWIERSPDIYPGPAIDIQIHPDAAKRLPKGEWVTSGEIAKALDVDRQKVYRLKRFLEYEMEDGIFKFSRLSVLDYIQDFLSKQK